ncbi:MAG: zf-HC2 domain-containing protein [Candidatus Aminicenantes bacterium]|nr:zf-HC2 domain-containing protein [Candidatus Aminicenantes bacterium]
MTCDAIRDLFSGLLDGELPAAERARIEAHLTACADCRELWTLLVENRDALAAFPEVEPSPALQARLAAVVAPRRPLFVRLHLALMPRLQPALAVLSTILIAISMYAFHPDRTLIDRSISRRIHLAYSRVETLYVRAEGWTGRLGEMTSNVLDAVKPAKGDDGGGDRSQ